MTSTKHTEAQHETRCSCRIIHAIMDEGIWYCALHGAAPELLEALQAAEHALNEFVAADCAHCGGEGSWKPDGSKMLAVAHKGDCPLIMARAAITKTTEAAK